MCDLSVAWLETALLQPPRGKRRPDSGDDIRLGTFTFSSVCREINLREKEPPFRFAEKNVDGMVALAGWGCPRMAQQLAIAAGNAWRECDARTPAVRTTAGWSQVFDEVSYLLPSFFRVMH